MYLNGAVLDSSKGGDCLKFPLYINNYLNKKNYLEAWYRHFQIAQSSVGWLDDGYEEKEL
jgi:hypothetical protein